jgi:hypothetical protein
MNAKQKKKMMLAKSFFEAITNAENWSLNFTKVSKQVGIPISTAFDKYQKSKDRIEIELKVRVKSDLEMMGFDGNENR